MAKLFLGSTELSDTSKVSSLETNVEDLNGQSETIATALVELHNEIGDIESLLAAI